MFKLMLFPAFDYLSEFIGIDIGTVGYIPTAQPDSVSTTIFGMKKLLIFHSKLISSTCFESSSGEL